MKPTESSGSEQKNEASTSRIATLRQQKNKASTSLIATSHQRKRKISEEKEMLDTLVSNMEKRTVVLQESDDADRHFLISLLPHYKMVPEHAKLDLQVDIINLIKKYKSDTRYPNQD